MEPGGVTGDVNPLSMVIIAPAWYSPRADASPPGHPPLPVHCAPTLTMRTQAGAYSAWAPGCPPLPVHCARPLYAGWGVFSLGAWLPTYISESLGLSLTGSAFLSLLPPVRGRTGREATAGGSEIGICYTSTFAIHLHLLYIYICYTRSLRCLSYSWVAFS